METARDKHISLGQLIMTLDAHMPSNAEDRELLEDIAERANEITLPDADGPEAAVHLADIDSMLAQVKKLSQKVFSHQ